MIIILYFLYIALIVYFLFLIMLLIQDWHLKNIFRKFEKITFTFFGYVVVGAACILQIPQKFYSILLPTVNLTWEVGYPYLSEKYRYLPSVRACINVPRPSPMAIAFLRRKEGKKNDAGGNRYCLTGLTAPPQLRLWIRSFRGAAQPLVPLVLFSSLAFSYLFSTFPSFLSSFSLFASLIHSQRVDTL